MKYKVHYSCICDIGRCRKKNQDNFICDGKYLDSKEIFSGVACKGCLKNKKTLCFGVFDGLGGEELGEKASYLAAREALKMTDTNHPAEDLLIFCKIANEKILRYAEEHDIGSMGTTAALIEFTEQMAYICNIGDSKIFRLTDGKLKQISVDHLAPTAYGMKPPLSQNLGIPPSEMLIEPYIAQEEFRDGDIFLICSDGLTDMLPPMEIQNVLLSEKFTVAAETMLELALANGGKDNITVILCKIECLHRSILDAFRRS